MADPLKPGRMGSALDLVPLVRRLLDHANPYALLGHPILVAMSRAFVNESRGSTRPQQVAEAFLLGAYLERERIRSNVMLGSWPVHDERGVETVFDRDPDGPLLPLDPDMA